MESVAEVGSLKRVVLTGSESTGKSVLAVQLSAYYGAELVPEFAREFAARKGSALTFADTDIVARGQLALEEEHAAHAHRLLIQDTDLLSTVVYSKHYYGECPDWIERAARARRPDLYLLLDIDAPWVQDGVRDRGEQRDEIQRSFRDAVAESGTAVVVISGSWEQRTMQARAAIEGLLA